MKTFASRHSRLMAQCTKIAREVSPQDARRRDIMARARRIAGLERRAKRLKKEIAEMQLALRLERKEFQIVSAPPDFEIGPGDAVTSASR